MAHQKLTFDGQVFDVIEHGGQPCLTLSEVAQALYGKGGAQTATPFDTRVRDLYRRHADEFTSSMTGLVEVHTPGGAQRVRVFSLRGAHLLGMLARTERAKKFRRWVLDIIDERLTRSQTAYAEYLDALREESSKSAAASICGRGLNQWRQDKPPLTERIARLKAEIQPVLPLH